MLISRDVEFSSLELCLSGAVMPAERIARAGSPT